MVNKNEPMLNEKMALSGKILAEKGFERQFFCNCEEHLHLGKSLDDTQEWEDFYYGRSDSVDHTYIGTYFNPYSADEEIGLWQDAYIKEGRQIYIRAVQRACPQSWKGEDKNISFDIYLQEIHGGTPRFSSSTCRIYAKDENGIEDCRRIEKEWETPSCYSYTGLKSTRVARLRMDCSEKSLRRAIDKAIAMHDMYQKKDWSEYAKDRKDFHEDTTKARFEMRAKREAEKKAKEGEVK